MLHANIHLLHLIPLEYQDPRIKLFVYCYENKVNHKYIQTFLHWHFSIEDQLVYCKVQKVQKYTEPSRYVIKNL